MERTAEEFVQEINTPDLGRRWFIGDFVDAPAAGRRYMLADGSLMPLAAIPTAAKVTKYKSRSACKRAAQKWLEKTLDETAGEPLPPCVASMGCLCAGHARGNDASAPCDTSERAACNNNCKGLGATIEWNGSTSDPEFLVQVCRTHPPNAYLPEIAAERVTECLDAVAAIRDVLWPAPGARGLPDVLAIAEVRKHLSFLAPKGGK